LNIWLLNWFWLFNESVFYYNYDDYNVCLFNIDDYRLNLNDFDYYYMIGWSILIFKFQLWLLLDNNYLRFNIFWLDIWWLFNWWLRCDIRNWLIGLMIPYIKYVSLVSI